jgi:hypothetical protein
MPIEIQNCDGGIGNIIASRGLVTDQELIAILGNHLKHDDENFKNYKYILFDHTALTKMGITNDTAEIIADLCAETSRAHPDPIVAMVTNVSMGAGIDLINRVSRMYELFINRSSWETMVFRTRSEAVRWIRGKVKEKFGIDDLKFC